LKRRIPEVEIIWRAFELRPEPVPLPDASSAYFKRMWEQSIFPLADRLNVKMNFPRVKPRSRLTHEAAAWGRAQGKFEAMNEAIFRAYFEHGEDIGQVEILVALASSLDLDGDALRQALDEHLHLKEVLADEEQAVRYGLTGVPAFIAAGTVLFGVQPADTLEAFVRRASQVSEEDLRRENLPHLPIKLGR
jgi:predicted DsbA family dithiol-disulfide isomerase